MSPTHSPRTFLGGPLNLMRIESSAPMIKPEDESGAYLLDADGRTYRWHVPAPLAEPAHVRPAEDVEHVRPRRTRARK
jgi:hypothetical protein